MKPTTKTSSPLERRQFLLGATLGTAGAVAGAAALLAPTASSPDASASALPADTASGYRETAHIRQYYDTTRL